MDVTWRPETESIICGLRKGAASFSGVLLVIQDMDVVLHFASSHPRFLFDHAASFTLIDES